MSQDLITPKIYLIRHGESLHNVQRPYPFRDAPLTASGHASTKDIRLPQTPDLIIISPMTRTIQTAFNAFPTLATIEDTTRDLQSEIAQPKPDILIWPSLREIWPTICNKPLTRTELETKFPFLDFSLCSKDGEYVEETPIEISARAKTVRRQLKQLSARYLNIAVVSHRGLIAYLVKGRRFDVGEVRTYRWASEQEEQEKEERWGLHCETCTEWDFGPDVLVWIGSGDQTR
ncbi:histidine phosphatase superfamily [Dendryphion nanum]|uniref:Histidine phosphatase superfamily n=1 Tax=Dendryphion nanum TaxID=256645 RepID=A0A9P9DPZ1_9PLEO|nr:histidine phosphatase superfamily [Dendryphion nanum]